MGQDDSKEPQEQIQDLEERLAEEQQKAQDYLKRLKYLQADFENYRKRTEREVDELTARSNVKLVAEILCVVDGLEMIHQNLTRMLEKEGLKRIDAVGKVFDPKFHEIVVRIPRNDCKEGLVLEEVRRGFVFKGRVLRPCMVNISCIEDKGEE